MTPQKITFEARIDRRIVPNVIEVTSSAGFDQINAECTIWCTARPSWADERLEATVWAKNSATGEGQIFGGEVTGFDWTYFPTKIGIICGDLLARTRDEWGGADAEYTSQTSAAVIRNILEKNAIPSDRANIEGDTWTVGVINPVTLKSGDDGYGTIIQPLDDMERYATFSLTSGVIVRRRVTGAAGGSAALTFSKGVTILSSPRHNRTATGIINRVIITGVDYEGLTVGGEGVGEAIAANPYVSNVSGYNTERVQSNLVEDDATALLFAQRRVADKNRRPEYVEFSVPLDPRVQPGMTISIVHSDIEVNTTWFAQHVAHSISASGATTTIRAVGGGLSGYTPQAPIPNFTIQAILEGRDTGTGVDAIVVVICDGSQSYDPDGTIATYAWTITPNAGTATPSSGSGAVLRSIVEGAASVSVTLTVTDNDGLTGALTLTKDITTSSLPTEDLFLVYNGKAWCSTDGEQTWQSQTPASGSATCLCPFAPDWGQLWGTTTGHVYATFDFLATSLVDLGQPHGAVACTAVWVQETDSTRLWAGFSDGKVYQGTLDVSGQTATWTQQGTITGGPSIVELRESYGTPGELRATAGTGYYYSTDSGASWSTVHTFTGTAQRMAAGFDTNLASALSDAAPIYDEDGTPPTVSATSIPALSFGWRQQELYAADDANALYLGAGPSFDLSATADTTTNVANHMIRSGNLDRVVYIAIGDGTGDNGFVKWIPDVAAPFFIRKTGTDPGLMLGYGGLRSPPVPEYVISLGGQGLILDLWNGSSNDSPPSGWQDTIFNTSAWSVTANGGALALEDADWVWTAAGASNLTASGQGAVFRHTFALSTTTIRTATLTIIADDVVDAAYLNGTALTLPVTDQDVSSLLLTGGSTNVLAVQAHDTTGPHGGIAFKLKVNA